MLDAAPHRGSDYQIRTIGQVALGVSNRDGFPDATVAADDRMAAAFLGTLDNEPQLRAQLNRLRRPPPTSGAAAATLAAFQTWGDQAVRRFRGAFAGGVTDGRSLWCFGDHHGFRPLFYRDEPTRFLAATEAKQVVAGAGIPREPDLETVEQLFWYAAVERSALKGVARFPRASIATLRQDFPAASFHRYWDPTGLLETARLTAAEVDERLVALLQQAVERCTTGRDAILLSGGIDSPTVAAFAAPAHLRIGGRPLAALSAVFPDHPRVDERGYTELVADHLDIPLRTYAPQSSYLDRVEFWVGLLDGPVHTIAVPQMEEAYRLARGLGARTVLTGELAEYLFGNAQNLLSHLVAYRRWRALAGRVRAMRTYGRPLGAIARGLGVAIAPPKLATALSRRADPSRDGLVPAWIDTSGLRKSDYRPDLALPARERWVADQTKAFGGTSVTFEADEICAAHCGVRVRRPFTDVDLWEFALSLPAEAKHPGATAKSLLRRAMRGRLPDAILERRDKTVFNAVALATAEYETLQRLLLNSEHRLAGVDYELLAERLERRQMGVLELHRARDLARIHAFLGLW